MTTAGAPTAPIQISEVRGVLGRLEFHRAAARLRPEPQFTPDLAPDFLRTTSPRNPFFRHAETAFFLAKRAGRVVGRVSATVDRNANEAGRESAARFGHFEVGDGDAEAAAALLVACEAFGRARKQTILRGPIDMSTNYRVGLLVEGHELPPAILMPWNPPGHAALLEGSGLRKKIDVVSMEVDAGTVQSERYERIGKRALQRAGYVVRTFDLRRFDRELELVRTLYNAAWAENWGFVPVGAEEFAYEAAGLKQVLDPELGFFVEKDGKSVAFALSIPDVAIAIREIRGRLLPLGWWRLLRRLKTLDRMRTCLLGIHPDHRKTGIDALLYFETVRRGLSRGFVHGEFGWLLEHNEEIIRGILASGARITRRYRIYEKPLGEPHTTPEADR